ncbi:MAG TPA: class I SAM-dependent methyltransferase [Candidatus Acidoferrum sp.]
MAREGNDLSGYNDTEKVQEHYDRFSPYYHSLWGELHHGYWIRGDETKEQAQEQLLEHLAQVSKLPMGAKVLDVGCGFGGGSLYLAKKYGASTTGITISGVQVEMAEKAALAAGANSQFLLMDAQEMKFDTRFDVVWSTESISHYQQREKFFAAAVNCLEPGGTLAITDWFKKENLTAREYEEYIQPIDKGALIELATMEDYAGEMQASGLQPIHQETLNKECAKTWDLCLDILTKKAFWQLMAEGATEFLDFWRASRAARTGIDSGNFVYGLMVAKKT